MPRATGRLTFARGQIVHATTDARSGAAAFREVLESMAGGRYTFRVDIEPHESTLWLSVRDVLERDEQATAAPRSRSWKRKPSRPDRSRVGRQPHLRRDLAPALEAALDPRPQPRDQPAQLLATARVDLHRERVPWTVERVA